MHEIILKIVRDGWPVSTVEILHDLAVMQKQGLLPADADVPETLAELSAVVNAMHASGSIEKVTGGWKHVPRKAEPAISQKEMFA